MKGGCLPSFEEAGHRNAVSCPRGFFILIHGFHESSHLSSGPRDLVGPTEQLLLLPCNLELLFERSMNSGMSWSSSAWQLWQQWWVLQGVSRATGNCSTCMNITQNWDIKMHLLWTILWLTFQSSESLDHWNEIQLCSAWFGRAIRALGYPFTERRGDTAAPLSLPNIWEQWGELPATEENKTRKSSKQEAG